MECQFTVISIL